MPVIDGAFVPVEYPRQDRNPTKLWAVWSVEGPHYKGVIQNVRFVNGFVPGALSYDLAERLCKTGRVRRETYLEDGAILKWNYLGTGRWKAIYGRRPETPEEAIPEVEAEEVPAEDPETPEPTADPVFTPEGLEPLDKEQLGELCDDLELKADRRSPRAMVAALLAHSEAQE